MSPQKKRQLFNYLLLVLSAVPWPISAHELGQGAHLIAVVNEASLTLRLDIPVVDLAERYGLDADGDGKVFGNELLALNPRQVWSDLQPHLSIMGDGFDCAPQAQQYKIESHPLGHYIAFKLAHECVAVLESLSVHYDFLVPSDPHRLFATLHLTVDGRPLIREFYRGKEQYELSLTQPSAWQSFVEFLWLGAEHILIGYDHILFLVVLLLPAVMVFRQRQVQPVKAFRPALLRVLSIVTAFTVAHSITLSGAILNVILLPPSWIVESAIAFSIVLVAINNLLVLVEKTWWIAFLFGLIHGFGFANVMLDLELPFDSIGLALAGFNVGVELGQMMIVLALFPLLYGWRRSPFYLKGGYYGGSLVAGLLAIYWVIDRL